jgi:hypothetical protein
MEVDPGDPLSAIALAILCNRQSDKKLVLPRKEYEQLNPRGMELLLSSTSDTVTIELVRKR